MVPTTRNHLPQQHHDPSGKNSKPHPSSYYSGYHIAAHLEAASEQQQPSSFPRRLAMADEDSAEGRRGEEAAAGTSSRSGGGDCEDGGSKDWLRLGLGAVASSSSTTTSSSSAGGDNDGARAAPMELHLLAGRDGKESARMISRPPLFPLPVRSYHCQYGHGRYRPTTVGASGSMTPAPPFMPFARPLRSCSADLLRVVSPPTPRTEAAGLWLTLQAAPNQVREPILPQIPKSYLRIRDTNMKVEVVLRYLAEKLGLSQSHQVELTCRGHLLPPFLQMRYVRDCIWRGSPAPGEEEEAGPPRRRSPATATTDHVMILFYSISVGNH
ncbi:protein LAX PANICLE 2-like [Hordeum vulgare subsp. vulgare]|uniref:Uncharacterized protein n=1 Tax=Hordeum vulgare subsp. vulgare TaxID=112509 RepID=A0A8I6X6Q9_HORVV|nr:protein LAX PANICLE 2-like [Hordeum vulgare subsp. vulgare]KAI5002705.1 hypothetical protein ZWY2020_027355 [Hordeum vulgare]